MDGLLALQNEVNGQRWRPRRTVCFVATRPKTREIHAPDFADRVLHHYLIRQLQALYEPVFIYDSYANRTGKGSHKAVQRLQKFMRQLPHSKAKPSFYLQLDIQNYFNSINRHVLYRQLCQGLDKAQARELIKPAKYLELKHLCHALLNQKPQRGMYLRATPAQLQQVPPHKRLENARPGCGIAVGNLSSQFFANVYLNELDQYIKHNLKARCYLRYVDDFVLLHHDPNQLLQWREQIEVFLQTNLFLRLKTNAQQRLPAPQPLHNGCDFLGYVVYPQHKTVRQRVINHCKQKLSQWQRQFIAEEKSGTRIRLSHAAKVQLQGLVGSYWGHFRHACHVRLTQSLLQRFGWLKLLFVFFIGGPPRLRWRPQRVSYMRQQVRFFRQHYPQAHLSIQKGHQRMELPPKATPELTVWIDETGYCPSGIKRREATQLLIPGNPYNIEGALL